MNDFDNSVLYKRHSISSATRAKSRCSQICSIFSGKVCTLEIHIVLRSDLVTSNSFGIMYRQTF